MTPQLMSVPDHRATVAVQRRERMRGRLFDSALFLVATGGAAAATIDNVTAHASVSRGTFYKYFDRPDSLLMSLGQELSADLIRHFNTLVESYDDPADRIGIGMRALLRLVRKHPLLGRFIARAGWPIVDGNNVFFELVGRDLKLGIRCARFLPMHINVACNLVAGSAIGAIHTLTMGRAAKDFPEQVAAGILRGLGLSATDAAGIAAYKFVTPPIDSKTLLGRAVML